MTDEFCGRVTIRLPEAKLQRYQEFKELVTEQLHSDVCYVIGELIESFTIAVKQTTEPPIQMIFPKQNIQINMGCTFHYNTKRARRLGPDKTAILTDLNHVLPEVINEWPKLTEKAQAYWYRQLIQQGIINPNRDICHTLEQQKPRNSLDFLGKIRRKLRRITERLVKQSWVRGA